LSLQCAFDPHGARGIMPALLSLDSSVVRANMFEMLP
jgi:hypothetical protein